LKRDLYQLTKYYNDPKLKNYYKVHCKILLNTIKETKRSYENIHILNNDCNLTNNQQSISNSFNDHFLSTVDGINNKTSNNLNPNRNNSIPMEYLLKTFKNPFPKIKYNYTSKK
jgi:hypothetical protein